MSWFKINRAGLFWPPIRVFLRCTSVYLTGSGAFGATVFLYEWRASGKPPLFLLLPRTATTSTTTTPSSLAAMCRPPSHRRWDLLISAATRRCCLLWSLPLLLPQSCPRAAHCCWTAMTGPMLLPPQSLLHGPLLVLSQSRPVPAGRGLSP